MRAILKFLRNIVLKALRADFRRQSRHEQFLRSRVAVPAPKTLEPSADLHVLVLGVYMANRTNSVEHLAKSFESSPGLKVEQRWVALNGQPASQAIRDVTTLVSTGPEPKFSLVNRLLQDVNIERFDFIIVVDDDIYLPAGFLPAFIAHQQKFDFSVAQPSRAWHSHFDHAFALRRPWLQARQTHFVECGPLVSFRRDAARLLLPFDQGSQMWGIDLVWAEVVRRSGLTMGIVDAVSVDHSLRPQAQTYDKAKEEVAMNEYLASRPHMTMREAFTIVRRYR